MFGKISTIEVHEYPAIADLWERSVRATHHFLREEDILYFKPLILNEYLKEVDLRAVRDEDGSILGFLGTADQKVEMLFIEPAARGKGIGKLLLEYALQQLNARKVDVNEANEQAAGFYKHLGFKVTGRSALDSSGKPYPILHMELI